MTDARAAANFNGNRDNPASREGCLWVLGSSVSWRASVGRQLTSSG